MQRRWIAYSIVWLLMGVEVYFLFAHWLSTVALGLSIVISIVYFIFGNIRKEDLTHPPSAVKMK